MVKDGSKEALKKALSLKKPGGFMHKVAAAKVAAALAKFKKQLDDKAANSEELACTPVKNKTKGGISSPLPSLAKSFEDADEVEAPDLHSEAAELGAKAADHEVQLEAAVPEHEVEMVRVTVDMGQFRHYLGKVGDVKKILEAGRMVEVLLENNLAVVPLPMSILSPCRTKKVPELKTMLRQTRYVKQVLLEAAGVIKPRLEVVTHFVKGYEASTDQIDLFAAAVRWSLSVAETCRYVPLSLSMYALGD